MPNLISLFKSNVISILLLLFFVLLWRSLQVATSFTIDGNEAKYRESEIVNKVSNSLIKQGDIVILSTKNPSIIKTINQLEGLVLIFDAEDPKSFEVQLEKVLSKYCSPGIDQEKSDNYFIWTQDTSQTPLELSSAIRSMNFYFTFQAVLPYKGDNAFAIDNVLRLIPKENIINRYCEANKVPGNIPVVVVIEADQFSPWIGSMTTGRITWLASNPTRTMVTSDFVVKDMPKMISYDIYWMSTFKRGFTWTFTNQDTAAYQKAIQMIKSQNGVVFVDKNAKLGSIANSFIKDCDIDTALITNKVFRQMCVK